MCFVSMVVTEGQRQFPGIVEPWPIQPTYIPPYRSDEQVKDWTKQLTDWNVVLQAAKKYDASTNQPNCEDPKKVEWCTKLCNRLVEIGTELIKDTSKEALGVELIQLSKNIMDTIS